jgi:hypothetical protein
MAVWGVISSFCMLGQHQGEKPCARCVVSVIYSWTEYFHPTGSKHAFYGSRASALWAVQLLREYGVMIGEQP